MKFKSQQLEKHFQLFSCNNLCKSIILSVFFETLTISFFAHTPKH